MIKLEEKFKKELLDLFKKYNIKMKKELEYEVEDFPCEHDFIFSNEVFSVVNGDNSNVIYFNTSELFDWLGND